MGSVRRLGVMGPSSREFVAFADFLRFVLWRHLESAKPLHSRTSGFPRLRQSVIEMFPGSVSLY